MKKNDIDNYKNLATHKEWEKAIFLFERNLNCVRMGNVSGIDDAFNSRYSVGNTSLILDSDLRFARTQFQVVVPQITHVAIDSGVEVLDAAVICEAYIKRAQSVTVQEEYIQLIWNILREYANCVAAARQKKSVRDAPPLVRDCLSYISAHVYDQLTVKTIARALRVSRSHLSRVYKAAMGETICQCVKNEKIAAAQVLLRSTQLPLVRISAYLGFSSQSHFTQIFRKALLVTPRQYRKNHSAKRAQI
jgi:AraC-like DNA-binding protein